MIHVFASVTLEDLYEIWIWTGTAGSSLNERSITTAELNL